MHEQELCTYVSSPHGKLSRKSLTFHTNEQELCTYVPSPSCTVCPSSSTRTTPKSREFPQERPLFPQKSPIILATHNPTRTHVPVILHTEMHPGKTPPNFGVISYDCIQINIYMYEAEVCLWYRVRLTDYRLLCGGTTSAISHGGRTCPWVSVEEISNCAKEPYRLCKNILCMDYAQKSWVFAKEPQISAKEPQISANELRISTTEPCVSCQT